jgi:hypothetical protein
MAPVISLHSPIQSRCARNNIPRPTYAHSSTKTTLNGTLLASYAFPDGFSSMHKG